MTDGLVEAVARALAKRHGFGDKSPYIADAQAALAAHDEWLKASGFAVVPVEPTEAMAAAGWDALNADDCPEDMWKAMIAAAGEG